MIASSRSQLFAAGLAPGRQRSGKYAVRDNVRVPFDINGRFLIQPITGVQRYAREIVTEIDRQLVGSQNTPRLLAPRSAESSPVLETIRFVRMGLGSGPFWEQASLPHGRPVLNLCNTAPLLARRAVVCIHDCNVFEAPDSYSWPFRNYYQRLLPLLARGQSIVTTVSEHAADSIVRHLGVSRRDIQVLPNGFEHVEKWKAERSRLKNRSNERPFIVILGSMARHKNISTVLGLAEALDAAGVNIKVVGGSASAFREIAKIAAPNIVWLGRIEDDDLAWLFSRALCLAFSSKSEGFGLPVLEAMACGCPVVASNRSSLPEVCGGAALLADPDDGAAWLRHFHSVIRSSALRAELSERGRIRSKHYRWAVSASGYLDILDRFDG